jgi:hypothetical protein
LVDAIALGASPDYQPPGHFEENEGLSIERCPKDWRMPVDERVTHLLGDREWTNFRFETSFSFDASNFRSPSGMVGIVFCSRQDGHRYEFCISRGDDATLNAALTLNAPESSRVLATRESVDWSGRYHSVRLVRVSDDIRVDLDGQPIFSVKDDTLASGAVGFFAERLESFDFEELEVVSIGDYEEYFRTGESSWKVLHGDWRTVSQEGDRIDERTYLGTGTDTPGLSLCPWPVGINYEYSTQVRHVYQGSAGVAFDIVDERNYYALTLRTVETTNEKSSGIELIRVIRGNPTQMYSWSTDLEVGQWVNIGISKGPGAVAMSVDGRSIGPFQNEAWNIGGPVGLFVGPDSVAEFAVIRAREGSEFEGKEYTFEPGMDVRSISHWRLLDGELTLDQHPATVTLWPPRDSNGCVTLQQKPKLPPGFSIRASFILDTKKWDNTGIRTNEKRGSIEELDLLGQDDVVLRTDPRIGISISGPGAEAKEYRVSVNSTDMRDLIVEHDDETVTHESVRERNEDANSELTVTVRSEELHAYVGGGATVSVPISGLDVSQIQVAVFGENLLPGDCVKLDGIFITPYLERIN